MDRSRSCHAPVRFYRLKPTGFLAGDSPDLALVRSCARIRGYLHHALGRGASYVIWNKHAFVKRSGLRMHYVEQAMRTFRKTTTEFDITIIRLGRSPRLKITYRGHGQPGSIGEVRNRLLGYIRTAARANRGGVAKVDARFLEYFMKTSGLPREVVGQVWLRLSFVPGCRCHWRGVGANLRFIVQTIAHLPTPPAATGLDKIAVCDRSLQETSLPHGSPSGRRYMKKTVPPAAAGSEHTAPSAQLGEAGGKHPAHSAKLRSPRWQRTPADPNPQTTTKWPAAISGQMSAVRCQARQNPLAEPIQVNGRWITGEKIMGLAKWLAVEPMQAAHGEGSKVRWRFAHARNFAARALRFGYRSVAILAAYEAGVKRSHDDAGMAGETARDNAQREPSAAVNYAWRELMQDPRSREERWAEIFSGERAPRLARVPVIKSSTTDQFDEKRNLESSPAGIEVAHDLPGESAHDPSPMTDDQLKTIEQQLRVHLAARHLTLHDYGMMPWTAKKRLLQEAINQRLRDAGNNK